MRKIIALVLCVVLVLSVGMTPMAQARTPSPCEAPGYAAWAMSACAMCMAASLFTYGNLSGCNGSMVSNTPLLTAGASGGGAKQPAEERVTIPIPSGGDADGTSGRK